MEIPILSSEAHFRLLEKPFVSRLFALNDVVDEDGRPLGEGRASHRLKEEVELETRVCPYGGSRHGYPMNVSALRQIRDRWPDILRHLAFWRDRYLEQRGLQRAGGWNDLFAIVNIYLSVPAYWASLPQGKQPDVLPGVVSGVYKVAAGLQGVLRGLILKEAGFREEVHAAISGKELIRFAETRSYLVAGKEACAAPDAMLLEVADLLTGEGERAAGECEPYFTADDVDAIVKLGLAVTDSLLLAQAMHGLDFWLEATLLGYLNGKEGQGSKLESLPEYIRPRVQDYGSGLATRLPDFSALGVVNTLLAAPARPAKDLVASFNSLVASFEDKSDRLDQQFSATLHKLGLGLFGESKVGRDMARFVRRFFWLHFSYRSYLVSRENEISIYFDGIAPALRDRNRDLFIRNHTQSWLEAMVGARLVLKKDVLEVASSAGVASYPLVFVE